MNTYTHVDMADKADAVGQLPVPAMPSAETPLALELARIAAVPWHEVASAGDDAVQLSAERTGNKNIEFPGSVSIVRREAQSDLSSGGGTRTPDTRIMIPPVPGENVEIFVNSGQGAAPGAAVMSKIGSDLRAVIEAWPELPPTVKQAIASLICR
jgi:hypothetical protein